MMKKFLPLFLLPLLLTGCNATFTNLTPRQYVRNADNLYPVEVAFNSRQQTLRWDSIKPQIIVGKQMIPMHPTPLMTNRWEGLVPVAPNDNNVRYHYRFDYEKTDFGHTTPDNAISPEYKLNVITPR